MVPVYDLSFERRAKWLTNGTPVIWEESMNTVDAKYSLFHSGTPFFIICGNDYIYHPDVCRGFLGLRTADGILVNVRVNPDGVDISCSDPQTGVSYGFKPVLPLAAPCCFRREMFLLLEDGVLLRTCFADLSRESLKSYWKLPLIVYGKKDFSGLPVGSELTRRIKSMQTSNGNNFLVLNRDGDLRAVDWSGSGMVQVVAEKVESFQLFGNVAVLMMKDGEMKLVGFKFRDQATEHFIVTMKTEPAKYFLVVPGKKHLWILTKNDQVIQYSLPPPTA